MLFWAGYATELETRRFVRFGEAQPLEWGHWARSSSPQVNPTFDLIQHRAKPIRYGGANLIEDSLTLAGF